MSHVSAALARAGGRAGALAGSPRTVWIAAAAAFLLRLPGLLVPLKPDEAGFLLVAQHWHPTATSLYGPYFVDRPPQLIAFVKLTDLVGGPLALRVVGGLACAALVLVAAAVAREVGERRTAGWVALVVAAIVVSPLIDAIAVKGELLGIPVVTTAVWLALVALRRRPLACAALVGLLGSLAAGFKQNMVEGLVFAVVLWVGAALAHRLPRGRLVAMLALLSVGAAVPWVATALWAVLAGVHQHEVWYAVLGFRSDASHVLANSDSTAPHRRAVELLGAGLTTGIFLLVLAYVADLRGQWRADPPLCVAALALVAVELVGVVGGGSFWLDYLFGMLPASAVTAALLLRRTGRMAVVTRGVVTWAVVSSVLAGIGFWAAIAATQGRHTPQADTGDAIAAVSRSGDTLVTFGGRADVQYASGLDSPYRYLWSLPMRTLDPDYAQLDALMQGPDAPTWFVQWVPLTSWDAPGAGAIAATLADRYVQVALGCGSTRPIYLLRGVTRPAPDVVCH